MNEMIFYKRKQSGFNNSKFVEVEVLPVDESFNRKTQSKPNNKKDYGEWYTGWVGSTEKRQQTRPVDNVASKGFFSGTNVRTMEFKKTKRQVYDYRGYDENQAVREYERKKELIKENRAAVPLSERKYETAVKLKKLGKYKHHKVDKEYSYKSLRQKSPMGESMFGF